MTSATDRGPEICNCAALRQAARHVTQFYDQRLAHTGLRTTQYSILARLNRLGPMTIGAMAEQMVMDRTTLGRNVKPLEREGLIVIGEGESDRRQKLLRVTAAGTQRVQEAAKAWAEAQDRFEAVYGGEAAKRLRRVLRDVTMCDLAGGEEDRR